MRAGEARPGAGPRRVFGVALALALAGFLASLSWVSAGPWLGLRLAPGAEGGMRVMAAVGPAAAAGIHAGDRVQALAAGDMRMALTPDDRIEDPDEFADFRRYDAFMDRQGRLYRLLQASTVRLLLADGASAADYAWKQPEFTTLESREADSRDGDGALSADDPAGAQNRPVMLVTVALLCYMGERGCHPESMQGGVA